MDSDGDLELRLLKMSNELAEAVEAAGRWRKRRDGLVVAARSAGWSFGRIAGVCGLSRAAVFKIVEKGRVE